MTEATPSKMQSLLADEFERRGWGYDLTVGRDIIEEAERRGEVNAEALAAKVPPTFLERNGAGRDAMARAIERALGGLTLKAEPTQATLIINDHRYSLTMSGHAKIAGSNINVGVTQINVQATTSKDDVLAGVAALIRAGLADDWNDEAASALASIIDARGDVAFENVQEVTAEVVQADAPTEGRARALLSKIAASGLGGALATGISAGLGELIQQL